MMGSGMADLAIDVQELPGVRGAGKVTLRGPIDGRTVLALRTELSGQVQRGVDRFVVDMSGVTYVNSTGLSFFITLAGDGDRLALVRVQPKVKVVFEMMGLGSLLKMVDTAEEGLRHVAPAARPEPASARRPGLGLAVALALAAVAILAVSLYLSANPVATAEDLIRAIDAGLDRLPPGTRNLIPPQDRTRLETLRLRRGGNPEDLEFLRERMLRQLLPAFERDAEFVKARVAELQVKVKDPTAVDVIRFKDGRRMEGRVLAETEESVQVQGWAGRAAYSRSDVLGIDRGRGAGARFAAKLGEAGGALEGLARLLAWCREANLKHEGDYVSCLILERDASHEPARARLGLRKPDGARP